mgnify:FL=1
MRCIDATYSHLLFDHLASRGIAAEKLLGKMPKAGSRIAEDRWKDMLEKGARAAQDSAFGLSVASQFSLRYLGAVGYLLLSSNNVMDALAKGQRYHVLISEMNPVKANIEGDHLVLCWPLEHGWSGQLWDELGLGTTLKLIQAINQKPVFPSSVEFVGPPPSNPGIYEQFFDCEVSFNQAMPKLVFPVKNLFSPIPKKDPYLHDILDNQAQQQLRKLALEDEEIGHYRKQLLQIITRNQPSLEGLAAENGISARSMQRRLRAHRISFQTLLDQTRHTLATNYLRESRLGLSDIAGLVGYTEQSSFSRAFVRWEGVSPGKYRRINHEKDND